MQSRECLSNQISIRTYKSLTKTHQHKDFFTFEQWLAKSENNQIEEAEIVLDKLPPRTTDNTPKKARNDLIELGLQKKVWNKRRRELHLWNKRAKTVGIPPLPSRRPTKGQRTEWEDSIVKAEGL